MPFPELLFASNWRRAKRKQPIFRYIKRANVVHHVSIDVPPWLSAFRASVYRLTAPRGICTSPHLAAANLETTRGKKAHYRLRTRNDGKFLVFGTGNLILAGKTSHASACLSSNRMVRLLASLHPSCTLMWPAHHSSPNCVVTGQIACPVLDTIKDDNAHVNYSNKFPGIALSITVPKVTPELYLRQGKIIIPGIVNSTQLLEATHQIGNIVTPHFKEKSLILQTERKQEAFLQTGSSCQSKGVGESH